MKKIAFILLMLSVITLAACSNQEQQNSTSPNKIITTTETPTTKESKVLDTLNIEDKYIVKIMDCVLSKDANGKDVVVVSYEFTNNTAEPQYFNSVFYDQLFQNGIEQSEDNSYPGEGYDWDTYYTEIKDGASITVYNQLPLSDTNSPVEIVVNSFVGDETITKTFEF